MTPDFTLIWPLSCLKDGVHLFPFDPDPLLTEIREVRNSSVGHPTKRRGETRTHFISRITMSKGGEPYRVCRRAFSLRGWSHVTTESVFPRSTRASGAAGPRARG